MYETAYVHGVGAVTSYGWGSESLWEGLKSQMPAPQYHTGLGGRFPDPCWFASVPDGGDPSRGSSRYLRGTAHAINEAIASAKKRGWTPGDRVGIVHATTRGDLELIRRRYLEFESVKPRRAYVESSWTTPSGLAMIEHGFTGPAVVASAACSSGGHALAVAHRLLACGDATDVIVVASDIGFDGEEITFFASLGPLHYDRQSTEVCRPFQEGSEGFVLGEAAAAIVLSAGAAGSPHASLLASELGNDHHHPVSIEPSGVEIQRTIDRALQRARIDRSGVEHYSAHGTGTAECSRADAIALASIGTHPTAHAFKPMVGHTMGAAPMVDAVVNVLVHDRGYVPAPLPAFEVETHPQLASGVVHHTGGATVQLGLGFGSNISVLVWGDAPAAS